jgi:uncharacterized repeat protein (TIGR02543 family)
MTLNPPFKSWILSLIIVPFLQLGSFSVIQTYALNDYTLTFETNGGNSIEPITGKFGIPLDYETTKEGHTFDRWYRNEDLSRSFGSLTHMPAENLTLYAKWNVNQYTITFVTNGGTSIPSISLAYGTSMSIIQTPTKSSYEFEGWYLDEGLTNEFVWTTMPAENLTLYAKWVNLTFISVSAGSSHSLAVTTQGRVYAWGYNGSGQLGDGTANSRTTPTLINVPNLQSGETIAQVTAGSYHSLAVTTQGRVYAWGLNGSGQLGNGTTTSHNTPTLIHVPNLQSGETIAQVTAGDSHSLAVTSQGRVYAWGWNGSGQLGDGTNTNRNTPTLINVPNLQSGETIAQVTAGYFHSLAVTTQGRVYAWGLNGSGQLGDGTSNNRSTPTLINVPSLQSGETIAQVTAGYYHSLAVTTQGRVYAWGYNGSGRLGDGTNTNRNTPTLINVPNLQSGETIAQVTAGDSHSLAVTTQGRVYAWGYNGSGRLGDGTNTNRNTPTLINVPNLQSGESMAHISAGSSHSLAVTTQGRVYAWGLNVSGRLGDGTNTNRNTPTLINVPNLQSGETIAQVTAGYSHSLAVTTQGRVYAWGYNVYGQLGNGTNTNRNTPTLILYS